MEFLDKLVYILLYGIDENKVYVDVYYKNETFCLTQKSMAELFDVNVPVISKYLNNIYKEEELNKQATISKMEIVQKEGTRNVDSTISSITINE